MKIYAYLGIFDEGMVDEMSRSTRQTTRQGCRD
jgi:hypothetical protein